MFQIRLERPEDKSSIESLLNRVFGASRTSSPMSQLRVGVSPIHDLCFIIRRNRQLVATIRYWPVLIGPSQIPSLLLGPVAVDPRCQCEGVGGWLIRHSLDKAQELGHKFIFVVGEEEYFMRFGFEREAAKGVVMPGLEVRESLLVQIFGSPTLDVLKGDMKKDRSDTVHYATEYLKESLSSFGV